MGARLESEEVVADCGFIISTSIAVWTILLHIFLTGMQEETVFRKGLGSSYSVTREKVIG